MKQRVKRLVSAVTATALMVTLLPVVPAMAAAPPAISFTEVSSTHGANCEVNHPTCSNTVEIDSTNSEYLVMYSTGCNTLACGHTVAINKMSSGTDVVCAVCAKNVTQTTSGTINAKESFFTQTNCELFTSKSKFCKVPDLIDIQLTKLANGQIKIEVMKSGVISQISFDNATWSDLYLTKTVGANSDIMLYMRSHSGHLTQTKLSIGDITEGTAKLDSAKVGGVTFNITSSEYSKTNERPVTINLLTTKSSPASIVSKSDILPGTIVQSVDQGGNTILTLDTEDYSFMCGHNRLMRLGSTNQYSCTTCSTKVTGNKDTIAKSYVHVRKVQYYIGENYVNHAPANVNVTVQKISGNDALLLLTLESFDKITIDGASTMTRTKNGANTLTKVVKPNTPVNLALESSGGQVTNYTTNIKPYDRSFNGDTLYTGTTKFQITCQEPSGIVESGTCGEGLSWVFHPTVGALEIVGMGTMANYKSEAEVPWLSNVGLVKTIVLPSNLKHIGDYAFANMTNVTQMNIPNSVTSIGSNAFKGFTATQTLNIDRTKADFLTKVTVGANWFGEALTSYLKGVLTINLEGLPETFFVGDKLDTSKMTIVVNYDDGTSVRVPALNDMLTGFDTSTQGTKTLTATYQGRTVTKAYEVKQPSTTVVSLMVVDHKTEYNVGDRYTANGSLKVTYDDGRVVVLPIIESMVSGFNSATPGANVLTFSYAGQSTTLKTNVTVKQRNIQSIKVEGYKKDYYLQQSFQNVGVIKVTYDDGSTNEVALNQNYVTGFNTSYIGSFTLNVNYNGVYTTMTINVTNRSSAISGIKVEGYQKDYFIDENFSNAGKLVITYTDGSTEDVSLSYSMVSNFDTSKEGSCSVKVDYAGKTTNFSINVKGYSSKVTLDVDYDDSERMIRVESNGNADYINLPSAIKYYGEEFYHPVNSSTTYTFSAGVDDNRIIKTESITVKDYDTTPPQFTVTENKDEVRFEAKDSGVGLDRITTPTGTRNESFSTSNPSIGLYTAEDDNGNKATYRVDKFANASGHNVLLIYPTSWTNKDVNALVYADSTATNKIESITIGGRTTKYDTSGACIASAPIKESADITFTITYADKKEITGKIPINVTDKDRPTVSLDADDEVLEISVTDNLSGIKEIQISGVGTFTFPKDQALASTFDVYAPMNGNVEVLVYDYAGNETKKTVKMDVKKEPRRNDVKSVDFEKPPVSKQGKVDTINFTQSSNQDQVQTQSKGIQRADMYFMKDGVERKRFTVLSQYGLKNEMNGFISGYTDGTFKPHAQITRAELCSMLSEMITPSSTTEQPIVYSDLAKGHWAYNAIAECSAAGLVSGMPDGTFQPDKALTQAEVISVLSRFINFDSLYTGVDLTVGNDVGARMTGHWSKDAYTILSHANVFREKDFTLAPDEPISRINTACLVQNLFWYSLPQASMLTKFSDTDTLQEFQKVALSRAAK